MMWPRSRFTAAVNCRVASGQTVEELSWSLSVMPPMTTVRCRDPWLYIYLTDSVKTEVQQSGDHHRHAHRDSGVARFSSPGTSRHIGRLTWPSVPDLSSGRWLIGHAVNTLPPPPTSLEAEVCS